MVDIDSNSNEILMKLEGWGRGLNLDNSPANNLQSGLKDKWSVFYSHLWKFLREREEISQVIEVREKLKEI